MESKVAPLRAVYYEDELEQFHLYQDSLVKILKQKSKAVEVIHAATDAQLLAMLRERPHVVFCDNEHGKNPTEGLSSIHRYKPNHPDTVFCLLTRQGLNAQSLGSFMPNPDLFISKTSLGGHKYVEYIGKTLKRLIRRSPLPFLRQDFDLNIEGPSHSKKGIALSDKELHSLLEQVIDSEGTLASAEDFESAQLTPLRGGFSGAGVFNLNVIRADGRSNVPAVMKISQEEKSQQELENFLRYVKWRLPYLWRVDILGVGKTARFGAVCYSFASGGGQSPRPVNDYIRQGNPGVIDKVLASVLFSENQTWYSERRKSGQDIREYFSQDRFYRTSSKREALEGYFYNYLADSLREAGIDVVENQKLIHFNDTSYPKMDQLIFSHGWGEVVECVSHGDLNGANLLYAGGESPIVFIDFEDTGFWHVFRDFVSFEASVRIEYPEERLIGESDFELFTRFLAAERVLVESMWKPLDQNSGYVHYISRVRYTANKNFQDEPFALYLVANIIHTLWLFERAGKWAVHKRLRMAATILESAAGMDRLRKKAPQK